MPTESLPSSVTPITPVVAAPPVPPVPTTTKLTPVLKEELTVKVQSVIDTLRKEYGGKAGYNPYILINQKLDPILKNITEQPIGSEIDFSDIKQIKAMNALAFKDNCKV